ncbi:MAG TPA: hypothetical protein PK184_20265 [Phycisphaerae bacterium]|jgi:hypothetical protein|nr:hypothetical protein [Phycisphaerae bacterium]HOJ56888.1 hypothetical protein [Phycisphaerae bacterium]HOL28605.1 hypothetical protein [Phycisphaerae bacterium]HPP23118.1 hypothetical protein [Phycisphaerae bacterium]HPU35035.1 hypothetical protein [Phycisphaerae bacterium]
MTGRLKELFGMLMVGDGVLGTMAPREHCLLWRQGPPIWQKMIDFFIQRPRLTRLLAMGELAAGFWLAERQWNHGSGRHRLGAAGSRQREFEKVPGCESSPNA